MGKTGARGGQRAGACRRKKRKLPKGLEPGVVRSGLTHAGKGRKPLGGFVQITVAKLEKKKAGKRKTAHIHLLLIEENYLLHKRTESTGDRPPEKDVGIGGGCIKNDRR